MTIAWRYRCNACGAIIDPATDDNAISGHVDAHKAEPNWPGHIGFERIERPEAIVVVPEPETDAMLDEYQRVHYVVATFWQLGFERLRERLAGFKDLDDAVAAADRERDGMVAT